MCKTGRTSQFKSLQRKGKIDTSYPIMKNPYDWNLNQPHLTCSASINTLSSVPPSSTRSANRRSSAVFARFRGSAQQVSCQRALGTLLLSSPVNVLRFTPATAVVEVVQAKRGSGGFCCSLCVCFRSMGVEKRAVLNWLS